MKRLFLLYIIPLVSILFVSCRDEFTIGDYGSMEDIEGNMSISLILDEPELRTRDIDLTPGVATYIDKIWIGIYDKETGLRVGGSDLWKETSLGNRLTASNVIIENAVPFKWYKENEHLKEIEAEQGDYLYKKITSWTASRQLCVVGIANYDNPEDHLSIYTNKKVETTLFKALKEATTWDKFVEIAINTNSNGFTSGKPMLMGYLYKSGTVDEAYTKINQFNQSGDEGIHLYPNTDESKDNTRYVYPTIKDGVPTGLVSGEFVIKLRRLRSKINVEITTGDPENITVTSLQYKVFNSPNSIYLAQRRTNVFNNYDKEGVNYSQAKNVIYSPNSADRTNSDEINGYFNSDWITPTNITSFAFDHFENKHWSIKVVPNINDPENEKEEVLGYEYDNAYDKYHAREKLNVDGSFAALTSSLTAAEAWNNNASYFILKMGILDKRDGKYGEVEYTIHEGFCNDGDGVEVFRNDYDTDLDWINQRIMDFSCVRNTNYFYTVQINSFEDIVTQVTTKEHSNDQMGSIWQMNYINDGSMGNQIVSDWHVKTGKEIKITDDEEANKKLNNLPISFKKTDFDFNDLAFRFVGPVTNSYNRERIDVCYNFKRGELDGFANLWITPSVHTEYVNKSDLYDSALDNLNEYINTNSVFKDLMNNIMIINYADQKVTIQKYIQDIKDNTSTLDATDYTLIKGIWIATDEKTKEESANITNPQDYMHAIYIFDRTEALLEGENVSTDDWFHGNNPANACSKIYKIYAAEQYPRYFKGDKYEMLYARDLTTERNEDTGKDETNASQIHYQGGEYVTLYDEKGREDEFTKDSGFRLSKNPDIAFRITGYSDDGQTPFDLCYNFDPSDVAFFQFSDKWAGKKSDSPKGGSLTSIPSKLLKGMKIKVDNETAYTITEFIEILPTIGSNHKFTFSIGEYDLSGVKGDPTPYIRSLYLFDKNTFTSEDNYVIDNKDFAHYTIYAAEQLPDWSLIEIPFDKSIILWDYNFYNVLKTSNTEENWFGGRDISTLMYWKHHPGVKGYKVQVIDTKESSGYKSEYIEINKNNIYKYFLDEKKDIIACPFPTTRYDGYNTVVITPDFDTDIVSNSPTSLTLQNALYMHGPKDDTRKWNFSEDPWSNLSLDNFSVCSTNQIKYDGLFLKHTGAKGTYPSTQSGNSQYIQFGSAGSTNDNYFCVIASEPGTITVTVSNTGTTASKERYVYIYDEINNKEHKLNPDGLEGTTKRFLDLPVSPDQPTRYYIYCDDSCRYYEITFTRNRKGGTPWPGIKN